MDLDDLKEIIRCQLADIGIDANEVHYEKILNYYNENGQLPDTNQYIVIIMQINEDNNISRIAPATIGYSTHASLTSNIDLLFSDDDLLTDAQNSQINNSNSSMTDVLKVIKNINTIPLQMYKNISASNNNSECLICYDAFVRTDIVRILPCNHVLHMRCIDDHLKNKSNLCPYCKSCVGEYTFKNLN